ncbi:hypothetical protein [Taylorella equigenitalis]|uniref:hypothetical protein n=1 Tax=Taylorella equigenitalis TaxID=29575 RepID=UPI0006C349F4|nr:hypothetical protein [Taylorella equigenitalis]ASY30177.1 hypothetical protein B9Z30_02060 [Taylorella equigenitalis]KOS58493.1 hypothetical protein AM589_06375 [Taylorella equigenitalis]
MSRLKEKGQDCEPARASIAPGLDSNLYPVNKNVETDKDLSQYLKVKRTKEPQTKLLMATMAILLTTPKAIKT